MAYEIEWAESAIASLIDTIEYIARDSPSYAAALAIRAERAAASLSDLPDRGRRVGEFDDPSVRELSVDSYRLIYRVRAAKVVMLAFVHKSRDLPGLLSSEPQ
ncbi:MAG TPA: type II toxin-antitoxin system RelE/ParE family toxin [Thermoanaerobaculia bacterium]